MTEERFRELYDLLAGDRRQRLAWWTLQCGEHQNIALELLEEVEALRERFKGRCEGGTTDELEDWPLTAERLAWLRSHVSNERGAVNAFWSNKLLDEIARLRPPVTVAVGDVVQIHPRDVDDDIFAGCFMTVTEPKPWGAQGYVQIPGKGQAYCRVRTEHLTLIGRAAFVTACPREVI